LCRIEQMLMLRRQAAARYDALLADLPGLERPALTFSRREISWFVYVVRLPQWVDRDRVHKRLACQDIATGRYFAPLHLHPSWKQRQIAGQPLALTESIARRTLALPFFNRITDEQQEEVVAALRVAISGAV
jgi:perosamine synthetase